ncbi:MAG: DUF4395 domain-containing protein [Desulfococcaceae bacterium]
MSEETSSENGMQDGVPMPIVVLNRWTLLVGVLLAFATQQAWITTLLFLMLAGAVFGGPDCSLVAMVGRKLFADRIPGAEREDFKLARFNNSIALGLLGLAQIAFATGVSALGWILALMVAFAAGLALAGFCVGCFLFFQFRMLGYRFFGK